MSEAESLAKEWASNPDAIEQRPGASPSQRFGGVDPRSIPSRDAYDAIREAADIAAGKVAGANPEDGKEALRFFLTKEQHGPAYNLAARFAFEDGIDLGIDYFNPQAYEVFRGQPAEATRQVYGWDPTAGFGGTKEKREKRSGPVDQQRVQDIVNMLPPAR